MAVDEINNEQEQSNKELIVTKKQENLEEKIVEVEKINEEIKEQEEIQAIKEMGATENDVEPVKTKKNNKIRLVIILTISFFIAIVLLFGIIVCVNKLNDKVYKNVYVLEYDMTGMSKEQVTSIITKLNDELKSKSLTVYQDTDEIYKVLSEEINFEINIAGTLKNIMGFGRTDNIFIDNFNIVKALVVKEQIELVFTYDTEKLDNVLKNIDLSIKNRAVETSYSIDEENKKLVITNGKSGNSINYDTEKEKILTSLKDLKTQNIVLNIENKSPDKLDLQTVYDKVKREPQDAYVDDKVNPIKFVSEVVGLDFDITELKKELEKSENLIEGKVIEFPLTVTEPKVKIKDISSKYYNDKLSGCTTYFDASQTARVNNLNVALNALNEKIIMPGEIFSYNDTIGDTTAAKGYMAAATFKGGTVVNEMGGGICQTTSTLYNAVLMANLEIVERHQHGLPVGYVKPSLDATVYSPVLDFKFKNTRNYPIKIVTSFSYSGNLNISIYGIKEENEIEIYLTSQIVGTVPFTTKYIYDNTLENGKQEIISAGVNGYISEGYITKKQNGNIVSSVMLSRDTYNPQQQIIKVGTKNIES